MQLFYNPILSIDNQYFTFDKEESKHINNNNVGTNCAIATCRFGFCQTYSLLHQHVLQAAIYRDT